MIWDYTNFLSEFAVLMETGLLVFCRISGILYFLPGFGETFIPIRARLATAIALTTVAVPHVDGYAVSIGIFEAVALIPSELLVGLIIGISIRLLYIALQIAGAVAAQVTSLSQLLGGASMDPQPVLSSTLLLGGLAIVMASNFGVYITSFIINSYLISPIGAGILSSIHVEVFVRSMQEVFVLAITLAGPFIVLSILYNLGLGLINRAMPQLMVALVGAPAITFGTIFMSISVMPLIIEKWSINFFDAIFR